MTTSPQPAHSERRFRATRAWPSGANIILVPVNFSDNCRKALRMAASLAEDTGACLTIVHVIHDPAHAPGFYNRDTKGNAVAHIHERAAAMMREFLTEMGNGQPTQSAIKSARVELIEGIPASRILELEKAMNPTLIVLGSRGNTGLKRLLFGSTAERVARLCQSPVLVVKATDRGQ